MQIEDVNSQHPTMAINPSYSFKHRHGARRSKQPIASATWSDLPDDILELITDKMLFISDLTRFRCVCKSWNSFHKTKPLPTQHPWLLCYDNHNGYRLFEPYSNFKTPKFDFLRNFHVCASKKGWLLLRHRTSPWKAIAYNPFTMKVITLPPMNSSLASLSFSTLPLDPDCVFFMFNESPLLFTTTIGIWRRNEPNWRTIEFSGIHLMKNFIFSRGSFYCSSDQGVIGVFSIQDRSWRMMKEIRPVITGDPSPYESRLVEFNGRIFLVILRISISEFPSWAVVFELDLSKKEWVRKQSLEEMVVFVDGSAAIATAACVTKSKDRVHYFDGTECWFFPVTGNRGTSAYESTKPYLLGPDEQGCKKLLIEPPY